ncbi:MAG: AsmA family protein, partial [Pseudomonadota bacterium]
MSKAVRTIIVISLAFVVLGVGALFVISTGISTDTARQAIERRMAEITGLPVRLRGRTEVHFFPAPYAVFNGVRIASSDGPTIITIERVEADFDMVSLFRSIPTFSSFHLFSPDIRFGVDQNGLLRWPSVEAVARQGSATEAPPALADNLALSDIIRENLPPTIGRISFEGGTLGFVDQEGNNVPFVSSLDGSLNWPRRDGALSLQASFEHDGTDGQFSLNTDSVGDLYAVDGGGLTFAFTLDGTRIEFDGRSAIAEPRFATGALLLEFERPGAINRWIDDAPLLTAGIDMLRLSGEASATANRLRMDNATLVVNEESGSGAVELLRRDSGRRVLTSTLAFETLDVSRLSLPTWRAMTRLVEPAGGLRQYLTGVDADLRVSASTAQFFDTELTNFAGALTVRDEMFSVDIGDATYAGGSVQMRYTDAQKTGDKGAQLSFRMSDVNSATLADHFELGPLFPRAQLDVTGDFQGVSGTLMQFWNSATGKLTLSAEAGNIPGVQLDGAF